MLRHDRASIRAHRERVIAKRKKLLDAIWAGGYQGDKSNYPFRGTPPPLGMLAKFSWHHHSCYMCNERYDRAKEKNKDGKLSKAA